jgi:hypothetical protein
MESAAMLMRSLSWRAVLPAVVYGCSEAVALLRARLSRRGVTAA